MPYTEGACMNWGYALAKREFRDQIVTEHETWISGNKETDPGLSVEDNSTMIYTNYSLMSENQKNDVKYEVEAALKLWDSHGNGQWKHKLLIIDSLADVLIMSSQPVPQISMLLPPRI